MTWKRPPARPAKQIEGDIAPRETAPSTGLCAILQSDLPAAIEKRISSLTPPSPHAEDARGRRIRLSARGKECQVRYVGICSRDPAHTIWSHARWGAQLGEGGKGMGTKADDLAGAYACTPCDAAFDQMRGIEGTEYTRETLDLDWLMGHLRSLGILQRDGLV